VSDVFIVAAKRTAFGTFGGKFVKTSSTDLMVHASKAALEAGKVNPELVNSVIIGNVIQVLFMLPFVSLRRITCD
jgi:acetyl-CoA acyltransferase 2